MLTTGRKKSVEFRVDDNGCFIVTSHDCGGDGYPDFFREGKKQGIHRFVYKECFGEIPDGFVVRHKCDKRSCINPEHLEIGTHAQNMNDRNERGRTARGKRHGMSLITEETALKIKRMLAEGYSTNQVVEFFGVTRNVVRGIKEKKAWKHVDL